MIDKGQRGLNQMQEVETGRRSLKEKQRQEREDLILQVAEEVLMEKGYYETSMDEIALRVGIAKGTVYLHFARKEDLIYALFERSVSMFLHAVEEIMVWDETARAKLEAILHKMYEGLAGKRMQMFISMHSNPELHKGLWEHKAKFRDVWEHLGVRITELLEEGKAAGEFDTAIPTAVMLNTFFSLLSLRGFERLLVDGQIQPGELVTYLGCIYFKGITT
jgi:TetR/AcrR family transcriptional regulator, fatty acid metabolism regulator protein